MRSDEDRFDQWLDERIAGRTSAPPTGSPVLDSATAAFTDAYALLGTPRAPSRKDVSMLSRSLSTVPEASPPASDPRRTVPLRRSIASFVTLGIVAAVLIAGLWQAGAFRDLLPSGYGDEPIDFAAIPFLNNDDDDRPDIVASPAAAGICPEVEKSESEAEGTIDSQGFIDLLAVCAPEFTWPADIQPDWETIEATILDRESYSTLGGPRGLLTGYNQCAWSHVWIEAMHAGRDAESAEAKGILLDLIPEDSATRDALLDNDVAGFSVWAMQCYPMTWAVTPVEAPAGTGTDDVMPDDLSASPQAEVRAECNLGRDMPIVVDGTIKDPSVTYLRRTADGALSLVCGETSIELLTQVQGVNGLDYPGIVNVTFEPVDLATRRQGLFNIETGELLMYGAIPESVQFDTIHPKDSPWFIAPDVDDPTRWTLTDLRTFELRDFSNDLGLASASDTFVLADYAPQTDKLLVGQVTASLMIDDTPSTLNMIVFDGTTGEISEFPGSLDEDYVPTSLGIDATGTTAFVYGQMNPASPNHVSGETPKAQLKVFDLASGEELLMDDSLLVTNAGPQWAANRTKLVYANANLITTFEPASREATSMATVPEGDTFGDIEYGPDDTRFIVPHYTPSVDEDGEDDTELAGYIVIDVDDGATWTIDGWKVAPNTSPWPYFQRFVVVADDPDISNGRVTIYDLTTMERVQNDENVLMDVDQSSMGKGATASTEDGTKLIVAFDPANPTVILLNGDMNEVTTLFAPGSQPAGLDLTSIAMSSDGSWLGAWPETQDNSGGLIDLSGPNIVLVEVEVTRDVAIDGFVKGIDD